MDLFGLLRRVPSVTAAELRAELDGGGGEGLVLLDVREPGEYQRRHLPGARHIPLGQLADRARELDPASRIVAYCGSGRRSRSAASILLGLKFGDVRNLAGGIDGWYGPVAQGAYDHGFFLLGDAPTPAQALGFALSLEQSSRDFYAGIGERMAGKDRDLLESLVQAEDRHTQLLRECAARLGIEPAPGAGEQASDWLEGVIRVERALAWATVPGRSGRDILDLAMQVEANSLDLYLKLARRADLAKLQQPLAKLIVEEKAHLAALGARLDEHAA